MAKTVLSLVYLAVFPLSNYHRRHGEPDRPGHQQKRGP